MVKKASEVRKGMHFRLFSALKKMAVQTYSLGLHFRENGGMRRRCGTSLSVDVEGMK